MLLIEAVQLGMFIESLLRMMDSADSEYLRWKRNNVILRGYSVGVERYGSWGRGLYTVPLSQRSMAREYGVVKYVVGAKPKHPKVVQSVNDAEILRWELVEEVCKFYGEEPRLSVFEQYTSMDQEMLKRGYDGLIIKGREMVNYKPSDDIKVFDSEKSLYEYYLFNVLSSG